LLQKTERILIRRENYPMPLMLISRNHSSSGSSELYRKSSAVRRLVKRSIARKQVCLEHNHPHDLSPAVWNECKKLDKVDLDERICS
jgi:hypothetical protein